MLKAALVNHCLSILMNRAASADKQLQDLKEDLQGESKSSAGDKHETGRAMVQLEMEKLADQRKDLQLMLDKWSQIDFSTPDSRVKVGSLVVTNSGIFLLAVALGTTMFEAENVVVLSSLSPLAQQLIGKTINDEIKLNNHLYKIIAIQ
jgi:hypothetical protein